MDEGGFALTRPGTVAAYVGPCVARSKETAARLIRRCLTGDQVWFWDLFPANTAAVSIARDLGFTRQRALVRMRRGAEAPEDTARIYAIAGFELG